MAKEAKKSNKNKKDGKNKSFFKEFKAELKRVSWPTFKQLVNNTGIVIAIVLIIAAIVFVLDVIFENLNSYGVERLKALVTSSSSDTVQNGDENQAKSGDSNEAEMTGEVQKINEDAVNMESNTETNTDNTSVEENVNENTSIPTVTEEEATDTTNNNVESSVENQ